MVTPTLPPESRPHPIRLLAYLIGSIALATLLACSNGAKRGPAGESPGIQTVLTRRIAETYIAYQAGDCDRVLERTNESQLDPRGTEADFGELLIRAFCLERSGDVAAASALYEQLSTKAPLSFAALDARERLRILDLQARDPEYRAWVRAAPERAAPIGEGRPPVDRVKATYPPVPYALRLEGYAIVEFGVLPDGQTDAVLVVDAQPPLLFDGTALRAVREWRYSSDPKAKETQRQVVRIVFRSPRDAGPSEESMNEPGSASN